MDIKELYELNFNFEDFNLGFRIKVTNGRIFLIDIHKDNLMYELNKNLIIKEKNNYSIKIPNRNISLTEHQYLILDGLFKTIGIEN